MHNAHLAPAAPYVKDLDLLLLKPLNTDMLTSIRAQPTQIGIANIASELIIHLGVCRVAQKVKICQIHQISRTDDKMHSGCAFK